VNQPAPDLARYRPAGYHPGASPLRRAVWYLTNALLFASPLVPFSMIKRVLLRAFGARIGRGVVLKPGVSIKYPWRLAIGDHSWIGEGVWIDNLTHVSIGRNACLSQGAFVLTGNHDYTAVTFDLIVRPVDMADGAWIGAKAIVCPGVTVGRNAVVTVGSVLTHDAEPNGIYAGNPAREVRKRVIRSAASPEPRSEPVPSEHRSLRSRSN
jgi:putative colanic acid biosynthesis acetyltransferase WcaF